MKLSDLLNQLNIVAFGAESAKMLSDFQLKMSADDVTFSIESVDIDFKNKIIYLTDEEKSK